MDINSVERQQNNFDFLRLFAAICITFAHSFNHSYSIYIEPLYYFSNGKITFADVGLCIFFSISGFLIVKSLVASSSIKNYLWKRVLRIQPLLVVLSILTVFLVGPFFTSLSLSDYFSHAQTWSYFRNIFPLTGLQFHLPSVFNNYTGEKGVNGSLWTLIIEERLYLILALIYFILGSGKRSVYLLALIFNAWYLLSIIINLSSFPYFNNIAGFYGVIFLNAGALYLMGIEFSKKISIFLVMGILLFLLPTIYPLFSYLLVIAIPILVIAIANIKTVLNKAGKYGDFTYGIYVFSFPVQQMLSSIQLFKNNPYIQFWVTLAIVFPLAIMSWHLLEKKVLRFKNYYF